MGALAEGVLTFVFCFLVLSVVVKGPKSPLLKVWLLSNVTAGLVWVGRGYTGPSMNPANAFGWAYANDKHNLGAVLRLLDLSHCWSHFGCWGF